MNKVSSYGAYQSSYYEGAVQRRKQQEAAKAGKTEENSKNSKVQLSERAQELLKELQKKYGNMDFIVARYETEEEAASYLARGSKEFSVLIDPDELEQMAEDPEVCKQYTDQLDSAVEQLENMKEQIQLEEGDVLHLGVSVDQYGVKSFFADIEKANAKLHEKQAANRAKTQKEFDARLAKKAEKKKADQKAAAKKAEKKKAEQKAEEKKTAEQEAAEKLETQDQTAVPTVQRVHVTGSTAEELLENIQKVDWSQVPAQELPIHGGKIDFTA